MVKEMDRMMRRLIGPTINLETGLAADLGTIRADSSQIDQLLVNFVVNARDAMSEGTGHGRGGQITVSTWNTTLSSAEAHNRPGARAGEYVALSVRDTGCGMDEATKQRIFEPFFTTKGVGRGTGMGLATVAGIVQQAGGFIEVETAVGEGTEMLVYFPRVSDRPATSAFDDRPEPIPGGRETVVIVEDDEILRTLVRRIIQVRGYEVLEAGNADEALQQVRESAHPVSLVLTSTELRGATVDKLAERLKTVSPHTRVIYVVDGGEPNDAPASLTEANDVLQKPFTSERLARKIRAVLDA
jgi:CheY-like chemotaxis protein